jgi:hypothetical protein
MFTLVLANIKKSLHDKLFYADVADIVSKHLRGELDLDDAILAVVKTLTDGK